MVQFLTCSCRQLQNIPDEIQVSLFFCPNEEKNYVETSGALGQKAKPPNSQTFIEMHAQHNGIFEVACLLQQSDLMFNS